MPKKFKDLAEMTQAIDQKAALEDAHILVERIASMGGGLFEEFMFGRPPK